MSVEITRMEIGSHRSDGAQKTVLVFGATGQQGGAVAAALLERGWPVRAVVRDPESRKARALVGAGMEVVFGDMADPSSVENAMQDVYGVFSMQPSSGQGAAYGVSDEQEVRYGTAIADIAARRGVRHLVYTSVNAAGKGPTGMGHFDSKTAIEEHIRSLPIQSTIVRPCTFMELLLLPGMGLDQGHYTFFLRPDQSAQVIAVEDIGRIVAAIFADPARFAGRTLEIAGDEVTGLALQDTLSRATGKSITYRRFPDGLLAENLFLGRLAALLDDGRLAGSADIAALERDFGPLSRFETWLKNAGAPLLQAATATTEASLSLR